MFLLDLTAYVKVRLGLGLIVTCVDLFPSFGLPQHLFLFNQCFQFVAHVIALGAGNIYLVTEQALLTFYSFLL